MPFAFRAAARLPDTAVFRSASPLILGEFPEDKALQVIGFRHAQQDRVIAALHAFFHDGYVDMGVGGGV